MPKEKAEISENPIHSQVIFHTSDPDRFFSPDLTDISCCPTSGWSTHQLEVT